MDISTPDTHIPVQLFLPATEGELFDFANVLQKVSNRLRGNAPESYTVNMLTNYYYADGRAGTIGFDYTKEGTLEHKMKVHLSVLDPIDASWDSEVAASLLEDAYSGYNEHISEVSGESSATQYTNEMSDKGYVEGYVEHFTGLLVHRVGKMAIDAEKVVVMRVLTPNLQEISAHLGSSRDAVIYLPETEVQDLETLLQRGEKILDNELEETMLHLPTPADLIMFTNAFKKMKLLDRRTLAFKGAAPYMDMPVLPLVP